MKEHRWNIIFLIFASSFFFSTSQEISAHMDYNLNRKLSLHETGESFDVELSFLRETYAIKTSKNFEMKTISQALSMHSNGKESNTDHNIRELNLLMDGATYLFNGSQKPYFPKRKVFAYFEEHKTALILKKGDGKVHSIFVVDKFKGEAFEIVSVKPNLFVNIYQDDFDLERLNKKFWLGGIDQGHHHAPNSERQVNTRKCSHFKTIQIAAVYDSSFCDRLGGEFNAFNEVINIMSALAIKYKQYGLCINVLLSQVEGYCDSSIDPYKQYMGMKKSCYGNEKGILQGVEEFWSRNRTHVHRDSVQLFTDTGVECEDNRCTIGCANSLGSRNERFGVNHATFTGSFSLKAALVSRSLAINIIGSNFDIGYGNNMEKNINHATKGFSSDSITAFYNQLNMDSRLLLCSVESCCSADTDCDECHHLNTTNCCTDEIDCDDGNICTIDLCINSECEHIQTDPECCNDDWDCDDGNRCTSDVCIDSECSHIRTDLSCCTANSDCDDGDVCTIDFCDESECKSVANPNCCHEDSECDNGIWCDGKEICVENSCEVIIPECDDNNPCTDDTWECNEDFSGCIFTPIDDCCGKDSDCNDGIFCNGEEFCDNNKCMHGPRPSCDNDDVCSVGVCSKIADRCVFETIADCCSDHGDCDNGIWCDGIEACVDHRCQPGLLPVCEDDDPCTISSWICTPDEIRCHVTPIKGCCRTHEDCQDGIFCNGSEFCYKNVCYSGEPPTCFIDDPEKDGYCDKNKDQCAVYENDDELSLESPTTTELILRFQKLLTDMIIFLFDSILWSMDQFQINEVASTITQVIDTIISWITEGSDIVLSWITEEIDIVLSWIDEQINAADNGI